MDQKWSLDMPWSLVWRTPAVGLPVLHADIVVLRQIAEALHFGVDALTVGELARVRQLLVRGGP